MYLLCSHGNMQFRQSNKEICCIFCFRLVSLIIAVDSGGDAVVRPPPTYLQNFCEPILKLAWEIILLKY